MTEPPTRTCIACNGAMGEIKVIDRAHMGIPVPGPTEYGAIDAKPSFWTGIPVTGTVKHFMCSQCGLINQYGVPKT